MPPVSNCGSGMSIPCSRMHCAKASIASRCSWGMSPGLPSPVGIRSWQASWASCTLRAVELAGPRADRERHLAVRADLRIGHVDAVLAHALGEGEGRILGIDRRLGLGRRRRCG
jgi:hypothetical protein